MIPVFWQVVIAAPFIGSFLALLSVRLPAGEDIVLRRSHCRSCGTALGVLDLIPVFGWLIRRGRCAHCGESVSADYPLIEIGAVIVAVWAGLTVPPSLLWVTCILGWTLLVLSVIDLKVYLLPDILTLPLIALGLAVTLVVMPDRVSDHVIGAVVGYGVFWALAVAYLFWRGQDGLGLGDAKLLAAAGIWLGWIGLPSVVLIGSITGLTAAVVWGAVTRQGISGQTRMPFGPFLAIAIWIVWLYGPLMIGTGYG